MTEARTVVDVAIVGGGPAGLTAAALLGQAGSSTALIAPPPPADTRTTALMQGSLGVLRRIGLWPALMGQTGALGAMRIIDDTGRLFRAPETLFRAPEIDHDAFGHNVENRVLTDALIGRIGGIAAITRFEEPALAMEPASRAVTIMLGEGRRVDARLVIGADGRNSPSRLAAGISVRARALPQAAFTVNVVHTRPHDNVSTEFHTRTGPFTLVPLPGRRSSLVLVETPETVEHLLRLGDDDLAAELTRRSHGLLGRMTIDSARGSRPLESMQAVRFGRRRIALVGEAAHVLPPIGAQGLNLGIRDAATIADLAVEALQAGGDPGEDRILAAYDRRRRGDAHRRGEAVTALNRSLLSDFVPAQLARGMGLWMLGNVAPLRRAVMRQGIAVAPRS